MGLCTWFREKVRFEERVEAIKDAFNRQKNDLEPIADYEVDNIAVQAVQAYLQTHKLSEDDVKPGLFIPWAASKMLGTAQATSDKGPNGNRVYVIQGFTNIESSEIRLYTKRLEIKSAAVAEDKPVIIVESKRNWRGTVCDSEVMPHP